MIAVAASIKEDLLILVFFWVQNVVAEIHKYQIITIIIIIISHSRKRTNK